MATHALDCKSFIYDIVDNTLRLIGAEILQRYNVDI